MVTLIIITITHGRHKDLAVDDLYGSTDTNHDVHMADMYNHKDLAGDSLYGNNDTNHDVWQQ